MTLRTFAAIFAAVLLVLIAIALYGCLDNDPGPIEPAEETTVSPKEDTHIEDTHIHESLPETGGISLGL